MLNRPLFLLSVFFLVVVNGNAQKRLVNTFDANSLKGMVIDSDVIFKINLETWKKEEISIRTGIEGETFETALLNTEVVNKELVVTTGRAPGFEAYDDKLAAHKVVSIVLDISLPEGFDVTVVSNLASVRGEGVFGRLNFSLRDGDVRLFRFRGSGKINTVSGLILIQTAMKSVAGKTRNGKLVGPEESTDGAALFLSSIDGDVVIMGMD